MQPKTETTRAKIQPASLLSLSLSLGQSRLALNAKLGHALIAHSGPLFSAVESNLRVHFASSFSFSPERASTSLSWSHGTNAAGRR